MSHCFGLQFQSLRSHVHCRTSAPGYSAKYVGETRKHLFKWCSQHSQVTVPVGTYLKVCMETSNVPYFKIIDLANIFFNLTTLEATRFSNLREELVQGHLLLRF